jgi:hypothetical protein
MKIAFLCGSTEPGVDGVGDYTLHLAQSLVIRGNQCIVIALNDQHVNAHHVSSLSQASGDGLLMLRIPASVPWRDKARFLSTQLQQFKPDWISLQYVPYAFNRKGLPWILFPCLASSRSQAKWHVMAHELWVDPEANLKNRLLATIQKRLLQLLLAYLQPFVLHTSNEYYVQLLASIGGRPSILPLFTNISIQSTAPILSQPDEGLRFILFGSIHQEWDPMPLFENLKRVAREFRIPRLTFVSVGSTGEYGRDLWVRLASTMPDWMRFVQLGVLPASEISHQLQYSDFGITSTPSHLLGKSGSVAAMLAHGLSVIVPRLEKTDGPWHQSLHNDTRFISLDSRFADCLIHAYRTSRSTVKSVHSLDKQLDATSELYLRSLLSIA